MKNKSINNAGGSRFRRKVEAVKADPRVQKLETDWTLLSPVERAKQLFGLVQDHSRRAVAAALWGDRQKEGEIRYLLKIHDLSESEKTRIDNGESADAVLKSAKRAAQRTQAYARMIARQLVQPVQSARVEVQRVPAEYRRHSRVTGEAQPLATASKAIAAVSAAASPAHEPQAPAARAAEAVAKKAQPSPIQNRLQLEERARQYRQKQREINMLGLTVMKDPRSPWTPPPSPAQRARMQQEEAETWIRQRRAENQQRLRQVMTTPKRSSTEPAVEQSSASDLKEQSRSNKNSKPVE